MQDQDCHAFDLNPSAADDGGTTPPANHPSRKRRWFIWLTASAAIVIVVLVGIWAGLVAIERSHYPYGWSHCCLKGLGFALQQYAEEHDGCFPAGAGSPEASLSLLYGHYGMDANTLRGKSVPVEEVKAILERGERLGSDTCGWHYVEGLTLNDDPRLALVWDKAGLTHNGRDLHGGHSVWFVQGMEEEVPASEWPQFLKRQEELMAARTENAKKGLPALTAKVRLPSGELVDHYDGSYVLYETHHSEKSSGSGSSAGPRLPAQSLCWYRLYPDDSTLTYELSLDGKWHSRPVQIRVSNGVATPDSIIFEMRQEEEGHPQEPVIRDPSEA